MLDLPYIVEVQIGLAVLWTGYRAFLSGQSFFARNRAFLLGSSVAAWIFPLLSIPVWTPETSVQDVTLGAAAVVDALPSGAETDGLRKLGALYPVVRGSGVRFGTVRTLGGETVEDGSAGRSGTSREYPLFQALRTGRVVFVLSSDLDRGTGRRSGTAFRDHSARAGACVIGT